MDKERRFVPLDGVEIRSDEAGRPVGIGGLGAVFGSRTVIGGSFDEEIAETFFDGVLDDPEIMGLFNHDKNFVLGRTGSGTLKLQKENGGVHYSIPKLPESRRDVLEAVERRDVTGNSFSFSMPPDGSGEEWIRAEDRDDDGQLPLRILRRAAKVHDFGPVTYPAYKATTVSARSAERAAELAESEKREQKQAECPGCKQRDERIAQLIELRDRERALLE